MNITLIMSNTIPVDITDSSLTLLNAGAYNMNNPADDDNATAMDAARNKTGKKVCNLNVIMFNKGWLNIVRISCSIDTFVFIATSYKIP